MVFIVKKKISGKDYFYLNETKRIEGKVVSKCLAYLGKDKKEAEKKAKKILSERKQSKGMEKVEDKKTSLTHKKISIEELANFCKAKGFVYRSSDIYGGFSGFWDYGPLGVELFNNIKKSWWDYFVRGKENMVGIDASIISHPQTWKASGHVDNFADVFVRCKKCKKANKIDESEIGKVKCECGGEYEVEGKFNLMFKTKVGAVDSEDAYLRGETAQAMFMDFKLVAQTSRMQLPFGIAQIGRCFRNEIAPRDFLFRSREFHIGEFEFFINPEMNKCDLLERKHFELKVRLLDAETQKSGSDELKETTIKKMIDEKRLGGWHAYWLAEQILWFNSLGLIELKVREHTKYELSHYSCATFDLDYEYSFGSKEVAGNADRGTYDLSQHEKESKTSLEIYDEATKSKVKPKVIEPTFGLERVFVALLTKAYCSNEKGELVLCLPAKISPVKAAIFPIVKGEEYERISKGIVDDLKIEWNVNYDKSGSIGRRYARNDEIGTPMCITIDEQTLKDKTVTIRDRDTTEQVRVKILELKEVVRKVVSGENLLDFGKLVKTRVR